MTQINPQQFLESFFDEGNAIQWNKYEASAPTDPIRTSLEPWVVRFQKQHSPFCLPRVNAESQQTSWYVLCSDSRQARSVRETLQSFIGPTYAAFNGEFATLSQTDTIERLTRDHFGSLVFRLSVVDSKDRSKVNSLLTTIMEFRDRESTRSLAAIQPIGRLLRDLEMAIIAGNEDSAYQIYAEIRSRGRLSATNLAFLQVNIFAAFSHWAEILNMPNLNDLLQVRRPKRISEQLATAVYRQFFFKHEESNDAAEAIDSFRSVGVRYQVLVRSLDGMQSPDAIKFAMLVAVGANPPSRHVAERLLQNSVHDSDRSWCEVLLKTLESTKVAEVVAEAGGNFDLAEVRYNEGNFDEAFELYMRQTPNYRAVFRVLEVAVEIDSSNAALRAIEFLASATDDIRGKILGRRVCTTQIKTLTSILGQSAHGDPKPISSLVEWFQCVDSGGQTGNLKQVLEYGIQEWVTGPAFNSARTAELLRQSRTGIQAETIRNAVPIFIRAFLVDGTATRENKPIYNALIELLIYDETIGSDDLSAVEHLVESILTIAPSADSGNNDFVFAIDVTKHLWGIVAAPRHFDWVLSMLDLLIDTGTQQHASLTPVLAAITESCRSWIRRVSDDQWSLLALLASDLNLCALLEGIRPKTDSEYPDEISSIRDALKGKSIAVYSLTERIARRFGQMAAYAFDGIKIQYVHDKALTDRMKTLARSADIFIINTWDAKHAATNGIKDNRPTSAITLEPDGKSASGLMRCLFAYATTSM